MAFCDFRIKYDPDKDTKEDIARKILYVIYIKRLRGKKPAVTFVGGDSGEGKSWSVLKLMLILLELQGIDIMKVIKEVNVYNPIEYPDKIETLLYPAKKEKDKERIRALKKTNVIAIHEAREVIKASTWHSFINQSIADINAMSRSVKRLGIFIISQFIKDIDPKIRYTLNYYISVKRPIGKKARLYINVLWKDDRDPEKPRLRKRKLSGYLVYPNGKHKLIIPKYIEITKPPKEVREVFEKQDTESKSIIIKRKIKKLMKEMAAEMEIDTKKLDNLVNFYVENNNSLNQLGKQYKGNWRTNLRFREMHELTKEESKDFEKLLNKKLQEKGIIENEANKNETTNQ